MDLPGREDDEAMVRALTRTADVRRQQGRHAEAARLYQQALDLCCSVLGADASERGAIERGIALNDDAARAAGRREGES